MSSHSGTEQGTSDRVVQGPDRSVHGVLTAPVEWASPAFSHGVAVLVPPRVDRTEFLTNTFVRVDGDHEIGPGFVIARRSSVRHGSSVAEQLIVTPDSNAPLTQLRTLIERGEHSLEVVTSVPGDSWGDLADVVEMVHASARLIVGPAEEEV